MKPFSENKLKIFIMKRVLAKIIPFCAIVVMSCCGSTASVSSSQDEVPKFATDIVNKEHIYTLSEVKHYRAKDSNNQYGVVTENDSIVIPFAYEWISTSTCNQGGAIVVGRLPWLDTHNRRPTGDDVYGYNGDKIIGSDMELCHAELTNEFSGIVYSRYMKDQDALQGVADAYGNILVDSAINVLPIFLGGTEMLFKKLAPDPAEDTRYDGLTFLGHGKKSERDMFYVSDGACINNNFTGGVVDFTGKAIVLVDMLMTDASDKPLSDMTYTLKFAFLKNSIDASQDLLTIDIEDGNYKSLFPDDVCVVVCRNTFDTMREDSGRKENGVDVPQSFVLQERATDDALRLEINKNKTGDDMRVVVTTGSDKFYFSPVRASLQDKMMYTVFDDSNLSWVWLADFLRFFDEWNTSR